MTADDRLLTSMKRVVGALRDAGIPFLGGGGLASWARGGPRVGHDLDFMLKPSDARRALEVLTGLGMRPEDPPPPERGEELEVMAIALPVMSLEDVLVTKLAALREHELNYNQILEMARAVREQIDWEELRRRAPETPFAAAFFTLAEGLGLVPAQE